MANTNYQEPIEKKDFDLQKKLKEEKVEGGGVLTKAEKKEVLKIPEISGETAVEKPAETEALVDKPADVEILAGKQEEKISEKIETARQTIGSAQQAQPAANVSDDAQAISQIQEFEKRVEKLVEVAVQKGPEHAIKIAQHLDKNKDPATVDNYTLDEIHDRLVEEELRAQLIQKGLLREL